MDLGSRRVRRPAAILAYTFGLRHAIDGDHIAAIDRVTRKMSQTAERYLIWMHSASRRPAYENLVFLAVTVVAALVAFFILGGGTIGMIPEIVRRYENPWSARSKASIVGLSL